MKDDQNLRRMSLDIRGLLLRSQSDPPHGLWLRDKIDLHHLRGSAVMLWPRCQWAEVAWDIAHQLRRSGRRRLPEARPGQGDGIIDGLAGLSDFALVDCDALGKIFHRHPKSIAMAARRGEFPPPMVIMGKQRWTAKAIRDHIAKLQGEAIRQVERRDKNRAKIT